MIKVICPHCIIEMQNVGEAMGLKDKGGVEFYFIQICNNATGEVRLYDIYECPRCRLSLIYRRKSNEDESAICEK